jgi:hypothetical protein
VLSRAHGLLLGDGWAAFAPTEPTRNQLACGSEKQSEAIGEQNVLLDVWYLLQVSHQQKHHVWSCVSQGVARMLPTLLAHRTPILSVISLWVLYFGRCLTRKALTAPMLRHMCRRCLGVSLRNLLS